MAFLRTFLASCLIVLSAALNVRAEVHVGDPMPVISVTDADGAAVEVDVANAGVVAVEFWASWCKACHETLPALASLARERSADGFRAIAVNIDHDRARADEFIAENRISDGHSVHILYDPGGGAMAGLGASGLPALYVVENGTVRLVQGGWTADGEQRLRKVVDTLLRRAAEPRDEAEAETSSCAP